MHFSSSLNSGTRLESSVLIVLLVFLIVNAVILFAVPLIPFIDLPNHLAEATIFKYYGQPGNDFSKYYEPIPWFYPNTFHAVFCSLFPSVEVGNKIFHILYIIVFQVALFLVIKSLNGNQWYGLLGLLFTYNYNVTFGFVGFAISVPTILFLFYFILLDLRQDKIKWKICISVLLLLLYSMHAQNALLGLLLYGILLLIHYGKTFWKAVLTGTLVALPLIILIFTWWLLKEGSTEESTLEFLVHYYSRDFWETYKHRFHLASWDNYSLFAGWVGRVAAMLLSFMLIVPLLYFKRWKLDFKTSLWSDDTKYAVVLFLVTAGCYFILPNELPGQSPLYARFCTIVLISFLLLGSVLLRNVNSRFLPVFSVSVLIIYMTLWGDYFSTFTKENRSFTKDFIDVGSNDVRMTGLIWNNEFRGRKIYIHFPNYHIVWNKGISSSKIIDYRFGIVRRVASEQILPFYHEYALEENIRVFDYHQVDYILAREHEQPLTVKHFPTFEKVRQSGVWVMYRNNK